MEKLGRLTKDTVYGKVAIADYEHSGDSAEAYLALRECGVTDTSFEYNGDGCTAYIEFQYEYDKNITKKLRDRFERVRTGKLYFVNIIDFELYDMVPSLALVDDEENESLRERDLDEKYMSNFKELTDDSYVMLECSRLVYAWQRDNNVADVIALLKKYGCTKFYCSYWREYVYVRGLTKLGNLRDNFAEIENLHGDPTPISVYAYKNMSSSATLDFLKKYYTQIYETLKRK